MGRRNKLPSDISKLGEKEKTKKKFTVSWMYYLNFYIVQKTATSQNHLLLDGMSLKGS
jgi:hypothetical protein